ncbi:uncharacterized oxidoreductase ZK1290.5-like [Oppia nitens]|uniref:uncharacterized oxidoreductase ZK1290.5-like n=1 Tax=Oppia nitens TaxID=1686743 RepID=UPI0023DBFF04|nr:uncharacterized oxidoreductase ZK1290.5-like [Oppia nitens]
MEDKSKIRLTNGVYMPLVGLGTSHSGGYSHRAVVYALKDVGYRLIDTAKRYGTESFIPQAIDESCVPREDIFVSTKLWPTDYGFESTKTAFKGSLNRLGVDYIDLFLIHWPEVSSKCSDKWGTLVETWRSIETLYDSGLCRAIGVSNYGIEEFEKLLPESSITPHINQIEFHPFHNPNDLKQYCDDNKIQIQGYSPLGEGYLVNEQIIKEMAYNHKRTAAQVLIRWSIQNSVPTIPKSTKENRVKENFNVFDFQLNDNEMSLLNGLHEGRKYIDSSKIKDKIDEQLPDGYKLDIHLNEMTNSSQNNRQQS